MKRLKQTIKRVRPLLGTFVEMTLRGEASVSLLNTWATAGFEIVGEIDRLMSFHKPDSDLSRLNRASPHEWVQVNRHTFKVLKTANEIFNLSKGIFDIRACSSFPAATGGESMNRPPTEAFGGDDYWRVRKTGPWRMDLGGIAKGYAVDCAVQKIKAISRGYALSGIVNAGGDLRRWGPEVQPIAVATSAVRTRETSPWLSPGKHVYMPAGHIMKKPKAVTVFSNQCLWSDALTKVMLLASPNIADACLKRYHARGIVL
jgi:thiamine biosynthesis lipoprotein